MRRDQPKVVSAEDNRPDSNKYVTGLFHHVNDKKVTAKAEKKIRTPIKFELTETQQQRKHKEGRRRDHRRSRSKSSSRQQIAYPSRAALRI